MTTAAIESELFLWRHPWASTDVDNPVDLLRDLTKEHEELIEDYNEVTAERDELKVNLAACDDALALSARLGELLHFVRGLRDTQKISELEYEHAKRIAKRDPAQLAQAATP